MCIIFHGSIDVDGLEVLPVSGGGSLCLAYNILECVEKLRPRTPK